MEVKGYDLVWGVPKKNINNYEQKFPTKESAIKAFVNDSVSRI